MVTALKKNIFLNNSLYTLRALQGFFKLFSNTQVGLINCSTLDGLVSSEGTDLGVITDLTQSYLTNIKGVTNKKIFPNQAFIYSTHIVKHFKKILVLLILSSL